MNNELVALVPVRAGSQRVKLKNFRPFFEGKSLLELKIDQLKKASRIQKIYISSDCDQAREVADRLEVDFLERDPQMCSSDIPWHMAVEHILQTIPGQPHVMWALATAPFFKNFDEVIKKYFETLNTHDSLVAVIKKKTFFLNEHGHGANFNPGVWHPYSQQLAPLYEVAGSCFMGAKSNMHIWRYWYGPKPYLFEVDNTQSVDIDTQEDFEFAQKIAQLL